MAAFVIGIINCALFLGTSVAVPNNDVDIKQPIMSEVEFEAYKQQHPTEFSGLYQGDIDISNFGSFRNLQQGARKWPNNTVYFETEFFDLSERVEIYKTMDELTDATSGCIKFKIKSSNTKNFLSIGPHTRCFSSVGMVGGRQLVGLSFACVKQRYTIMHELLHALGFIHEQSRPDREQFVKVFWENVKPEERHNFEIVQADTLGTPYTYGSLMHYGVFAFSKNRISTIVPRQKDVEIGRNKLHPIDVERIKRLYGCMPKCQ
ncbi:low choriolytic enzyme-like [Tubulanus polymorphus]|uniref:low choriolytic enzyme-like n=1 Tax=Tubulanus polymorphus TaxID=672921 RepID=UPI003DA54EB2